MNNKYHAELHLACTPCWIKSCSSGFFFVVVLFTIRTYKISSQVSTNLIQQRLPERLYAPYTISNDTNIQQNEYKFDMEQKYKINRNRTTKGPSHSILHNSSCLRKKTLPHTSYKNMKTKNTLQLFKLLQVKQNNDESLQT